MTTFLRRSGVGLVFVFLLVLFGMPINISAQPKGASEKDVLKSLEGTWVEKVGKKEKEVASFVFSGKKFTYLLNGKQLESGTFTIDVSSTPPKMDMLMGSGDDKGKYQHAIFQIDGDTIKIAYSKAGSKHIPKSFTDDAAYFSGTFKKK